MASRLFAVPVLALLVLTAGIVQAQPGRRSPRPSPDANLPDLVTEVAFPNLRFNRPVTLAYPEDDSDLLFVVEQHTARIFSFPNDPETRDAQLFFELPHPIGRDNEEGLLGLAFHPNYRQNGRFYVYFSATNPRRSVVASYEVASNNPRRADPRTEQIIWVSNEDPFGNHNGGCIKFGPDGYLYIALGDGGAADDPLLTGQDPTDWFASILRIDVDNPSGRMPYGIPPDNPARRSRKFAHWAPEVFAIGLRNVWKFSFDRQTGDLWAGDVGQNRWEEIVLVTNGGNYGWNVWEGFHPFRVRNNRVERSSPPLPPVVEYPHPDVPARLRQGRTDVGKSVTGGYVYRGSHIPELQGVYVFGDYELGRVWGVKLNAAGNEVAEFGELIDLSARDQPKINIAAFGEDRAGELYILGFDGRIHQFRKR